MKNYKIKITEIYAYNLEIEANSEKEALQKAKIYYETEEDGVVGVADACSFDKVKFKVLAEEE